MVVKFFVVYDPAKVIILKANHNHAESIQTWSEVVYDPAKVIILKANHNSDVLTTFAAALFMTLQR